MIVEGIDLPSVNGVGIWCDKNDQNLFQAACRGCRTAPGKTGYNIYVSEELSDCKDFLYKLYNGFDGELDFGDGQEDCTGTGSSGKNTADDNTVRIVPAVIRAAPAMDFHVNFSWRNAKASTSVNTTLSLSTGTVELVP